jgi:hypothetical protein
MNNIQELKQIIENAPDMQGVEHDEFIHAVHHTYEEKYIYLNENALYMFERGEWIADLEGNYELSEMYDIRQVSDIRTIVEQAEEIERLKAALNAVANWDKATKEEVDSCVEVLKALTPPEGK